MMPFWTDKQTLKIAVWVTAAFLGLLFICLGIFMLLPAAGIIAAGVVIIALVVMAAYEPTDTGAE